MTVWALLTQAQPSRVVSPDPARGAPPAVQRMTRHNDYYQRGEGGSGDPANPWGNRAAAGASYARALHRLGQRYGITHWG